MKKNIAPIVFTTVAFILLTAILSLTVFSVSMHLSKDKVNTDSTTKEPETSRQPENPDVPPEKPSVPPLPSHPSVSKDDNEEKTPLLKESVDATQSYIDGITFLGDSTTYHLYKLEMLKDGHNGHQVWFGEKGNTITFQFLETVKIKDNYDGESYTIEEMLKLKKPPILYITLGVTGGVSSKLSEQQFKAIYDYLITLVFKISPGTKVVCNTIFPICKVNKYDNLTLEGIKEANKWIYDVANEHFQKGKPVYYLDSFRALALDDGYLPADFSNGDGLHLNEKAYTVLLEYIRTHKIPDYAN